MASDAPAADGPKPTVKVAAADPRESDVLRLLASLDAELAGGGYTAEQTFGYSPEMIIRAGVHLVGAAVGSQIVGIGGVQLDGVTAELKRFYVEPEHRGGGVADAIVGHLIGYARERGARTVRLETGDKQAAAQAFYRRHGFAQVPKFPPYEGSETSVCMSLSLETL